MYSETATESDNLKNTSTVTVPVCCWLSVIIQNTADVFLTSSFHVFVLFLSSRIVGFKILSQVMSTNFFGIFGFSLGFLVSCVYVCVCARVFTVFYHAAFCSCVRIYLTTIQIKMTYLFLYVVGLYFDDVVTLS